jgi:ABC-2 type transport system ATP-binding protein
MSKTIISVKNLVKNYGSFNAVKGISFEVNEGEIFGLLGPNGAGKSTTLEIIETLREKTSGEVIVDGFDLDKSPTEIKKIIGVQLQTSGFYPGTGSYTTDSTFLWAIQSQYECDGITGNGESERQGKS